MSNTLFLLSDVCQNQVVRMRSEDSEEEILGGLILNRIVGIAYDKLDFCQFNKESVRTLTMLRQYYEQQYDVFVQKLSIVADILSSLDIQYAFLKGAVLTPTLYKKGQRISNDVDILIEACDATKVHNLLCKNGFIQGSCGPDGLIRSASRREIIHAKINCGETVPYLRYFGDDLVEVDVNFSLDSVAKGTEQCVCDMLDRCIQIQLNNALCLPSLDQVDFFIHLCCHLYKEATTYEWLVHRRDLMLYKFADINIYLHTYGNELFFHCLCSRVKSFELEKECYYTLTNSIIIYPNLMSIAGLSNALNELRPNNTDYMRFIFSPLEKRVYEHGYCFKDWFECRNRIANLTSIEAQL